MTMLRSDSGTSTTSGTSLNTRLCRAGARPTDTRAKIVRLTKRGVALRAACVEARRELQALAVETLGKVKLTRLRRDWMKLTAALGRPYRP